MVGRLRQLVLLVVLPALGAPLRAPTAEAAAQTPRRADIDTLLAMQPVESTLASLGNDFLTHFLMLAPNLPAEDREILSRAVQTAFAPDTVRATVARTLASTTSSSDTEQLIESYESGALAELRAVELGHEPEVSLQEFGADLSALDPARLRLMVGLVEATRSSDLAISVDEALRKLAYQLFTDLGGDPGAFPRMSDEQYQSAYRNRTIGLGVESMYDLGPADPELVQAAVDTYTGEGALRFSERYIEAMLGALDQAGEDLGALIAAEAAPAEPQPEVEPIDPADAPPCRVQVCGFLVDWNGPEPPGGTLVYRAPGDFEEYAYRVLVGAGYRLVRRVHDAGLTIQIRPSAQTVQCEVVSGTNPRLCRGVGDVRIELIGSYPGFDGLTSFFVRNRCRANQVMSADGIASLVAARIDYELTTYEGDERREPRC